MALLSWMFGTDKGCAKGTLLLYTLVGISHLQRYLAASVAICWGSEGNLKQHSMQFADSSLSFVEFDSIFDPIWD